MLVVEGAFFGTPMGGHQIVNRFDHYIFVI